MGLLERAWRKHWDCWKKRGEIVGIAEESEGEASGLSVAIAGESLEKAIGLLEKALGLLEKGVEIVC